MVHTYCTFQKISLICNLFDMSEGFQHAFIIKGAFFIICDLCESFFTTLICNCRPEHFFHISRIDSLISKEGTSVDIFDCITKCKELIPGLRNFQIVFVEECLIVHQALWTAVERCEIDIAISIWCTLAACKNSICDIITECTGSCIVFAIKNIVQVQKCMFFDQRKDHAVLTAIIQADKIRYISGNDLWTNDITDGRADGHVYFHALMTFLKEFYHLIPVSISVSTLEDCDVQFLFFRVCKCSEW